MARFFRHARQSSVRVAQIEERRSAYEVILADAARTSKPADSPLIDAKSRIAGQCTDRQSGTIRHCELRALELTL